MDYFVFFLFFLFIDSICFRLPMTLNTSIDNWTPKFHLKKTTHYGFKPTQVDQAIKKHNVRNFIKNATGGISAIFSIEKDDNMGLENHLRELKKSCSKVNQEKMMKENEIYRFKDKSMITNEKFSQIKESRETLERKIDDLEKKLLQVTNKKDITTSSCKSYEHMLDRMKKDEVTLQLNKNLLVRQLKTLQKTYQAIESQYSNISEFERMSQAGLKDGLSEIQEEAFYRDQHKVQTKKEVDLKIERTNKLKQRQKQTQQIQELAADNIQDADLIKLQKFLTTQLFLRVLLKSKIMKLKQHYEPHETALFTIVSNTHIKDVASLKSEFFSFQQSFNEKAVWVQHLQQEISEAEKARKQLEQQLNNIKMDEMRIMEEIETQGTCENTTKIRQVTEKSWHSKLELERIKTWIVEQKDKLGIQFNSEDLQARFLAICSKLQEPVGQENGEVRVK